MTNVLAVPRHWLAQNTSVRMRLLLIVGVLLSSAVLPFMASSRQLVLLIGLPPAVGAVLIFMRWPALGLLSLVIISLVVPSPSLPGGLNVAVLLLVLLIGLWVLDVTSARRETFLVRSHTTRPFLALVLVAILAFGVGQLRWFAKAQPAPLDAQLGGLAIFALAAGAFLLVAYQVQEIRWLQAITWLFLALGALFIAGWMVSEIGKISGRLFQRDATANSMFWVWLVALAFSQALLNRRLHVGWRIALLGLVAATVYVAFVTNYSWKSGWMPSLVTLAAIIAFRWPRLGLALILAGTLPVTQLVSQAIATDTYSYYTRIEAWQIIGEIIKVNPVLGLGPANYYWYTPLFPIRGYFVSFNSHSQYVDIIAQTGLLGLACFFWLAWELGRLGWRLRTKAPSGFAQAYVYGALGGLVGMLVAATLADWVFPFVYNIGLNGFRASMLAWMFLGGLVSIEQIVRRGSGFGN